MWAAIVCASSELRRQSARDVIARLRAGGVEVAGALQENPAEGPGWDAIDLQSGARLPIARASATPELCDWKFVDASFEAIRNTVRGSSAPVVVLEYGVIEARGRGNWEAGLSILEGPRLLVACVRPKALARIAVELPDPVAALELDSGDDVKGFVEQLFDALGSPAEIAR
jgi:hypothetical protein